MKNIDCSRLSGTTINELDKAKIALRVQKDFLTLSKEELFDKYTKDLGAFNRFLIGTTGFINEENYLYFFSLHDEVITEILIKGLDLILFHAWKEIININCNKLLLLEQKYQIEKHKEQVVIPSDLSIQAKKYALSPIEYNTLLINMPHCFKCVMNGIRIKNRIPKPSAAKKYILDNYGKLYQKVKTKV